METSTQTGQSEGTSETTVERPDWWDSGHAAHHNTQVSPPPVVFYPSHDYNRSRVGPAVTVAAGGTLMLMSALPWLTANYLHHYTKVAGNTALITKAISSNGWLTFTGGATLAFMGLLMLASSVYALRIIAALLAFTTAGLASYDTVRLTQRIHDARHLSGSLLSTRLAGSVHLGYGLLVTLGVAFLVAIVSLIELAHRD